MTLCSINDPRLKTHCSHAKHQQMKSALAKRCSCLIVRPEKQQNISIVLARLEQAFTLAFYFFRWGTNQDLAVFHSITRHPKDFID